MPAGGVEPVLPVRHAADDVGALAHRLDHQGVGARVAPDALLRERDELDRAEVGVVVARAAATPRRALSPPIVSTSTWERSAVVPAITAARITRPARSRISSTVAARLAACESAIASASVPVRLGRAAGR